MLRRKQENKRSKLRTVLYSAMAAVGFAASTGLGLLAYAARIEPNWIELRKVELALPRLPQQFDRYRVVQISDLHAGEWMPLPRLGRIVDMVNAQAADLIAITGDFVTTVYRSAPGDIVPFTSRLRAKDGVVAVLGNHDYWGSRNADPIRRVIHDSGMIDLNNKVHTLERDGAAFHIAGVDSVRYNKHRLDVVLDQLPEEGVAMLLAHEPDFADESAKTGRFDLQISGHSHGGQVVLASWRPRLPPLARKYHTGQYRVGDMIQYTNRGVGMVGLPLRFGSRPEITVFTLRSGAS